MTLDAEVRYRIGTLDLDLTLQIGDEIVAILGPNGAGKSTLLRILAGLTPIDAGRIELDGLVIDEPARGTFVEARRRRIGFVFQDYLLFPYLDALENVAFGLRARGIGRREARRRAVVWLARFGLEDQCEATPGQLSGGQAQRVALARAVAGEPQLLLLDEPLAALDARARNDIRHELRQYLTGVPGTRVIVTHDPVDAFTLADRIVILEAGRVTQDGSVNEIALHPRSEYVADLVGVNLLRGDAHDGVVTVGGGAEVLIADHSFEGEVWLAIHPRSVTLLAFEATGSARNHWSGVIGELENLGDRVRVRVDAAIPIVAEVTPESARALELVPGRSVVATAKATEIKVYRA